MFCLCFEKHWNNVVSDIQTVYNFPPRGLRFIAAIQNLYDQKGAMKKSLPHLASRNDFIAKEVLAFLCIMLFNANDTVQVSVLRLIWYCTWYVNKICVDKQFSSQLEYD